jgi:hypothetical protein
VLPHITVEALAPLATKFVPVTVRVNGVSPAAAPVGRIEATVGMAFTLNAMALEAVEAPPFRTVMFTGPSVPSWVDVTAAVICVAVPGVVVRAVEPQYTVEAFAPVTKFVPLTVSVNEVAVSRAEVALSPLLALIVGALTVNVAACDGVPDAIFTVMFTVPGVPSWVAVTAAVSEVALTQVVVRACEPQYTVPLETPLAVPKYVPVTVRVKGADPAMAEVALTPEIVSPEIVGPTVQVAGAVATPLGSTTVTAIGPVVVLVPLGTETLIWLPVIDDGVGVRVVPSHVTVDPATKPDPAMVSVNVVLAAAVGGFSDEIVGPPVTLNATLVELGARLPFWTLTCTSPVESSRLDEITAVAWVALRGIVTSCCVPHITVVA